MAILAEPTAAPLDAKTEVFDWIRHDLGLALPDDQATNADLDRLDSSRTFDLDFLELREVNPQPFQYHYRYAMSLAVAT